MLVSSLANTRCAFEFAATDLLRDQLGELLVVSSGTAFAVRLLNVQARCIAAVVLGVGLLACLGLSSSAAAQSIPFCARKTLSSVPASAYARDGQSVRCQTRHDGCPRNAVQCEWYLDGDALSTPIVIPTVDAVGRHVTGLFKVQSPGSTLDSARCSAPGSLSEHNCGRRLGGTVGAGQTIAGVCSATAGALTDPYATAFFNAPSHIEIDLCQLTGRVDYAKPNTKKCKGDLINKKRRRAAAAATDGCKVIVRPLRPVPNPPETPPRGNPPPGNPPTTPSGPCAAGNEGGGIDVLLQGEFFGQMWASGSVTATGAGIQTESASVGYDYVSAGHFGPWPCGSTVTLTAAPTQGNHFDHWESSDGSCTGSSLTCTLHITTKVMSATALFAPTTHQLTVINAEPDGVASSGEASGGYVNPPIQCGSPPPNGPGTPVYTSCSSPALAQRSDNDLTQLYIDADRPGPGGDDYGIASIDGCDSSVAVTAPLSGGGTFVPSLQCFIDLNSDRTITVHYKDVGAN